MTAGQEALREAARLEAARVYGGLVREHKTPSSVAAAQLEAELRARDERDEIRRTVTRALREGLTTADIVGTYGIDLADVRAIRKQFMAGGAA